MRKKLLKSFAVVAVTMVGSMLLGIIGVSRRCRSVFPFSAQGSGILGSVLLLTGLLFALTAAVLILRYFVFFTRVEVVDSVGNPLADNSAIDIAGTHVRPIAAVSIAALIGMVLIGLGVGLMFDQLLVYVIYLGAISVLLLIIALVIFLFSVVRHKIRRRFAWIAAGVFFALAVAVFSGAIPSIKDAGLSRSEIIAVTGTVSATSSGTGLLAGPGHTRVVIKGTSGESISLRYSGAGGELHKGKRYTFYYLPNTRLIDRVVEADAIQY